MSPEDLKKRIKAFQHLPPYDDYRHMQEDQIYRDFLRHVHKEAWEPDSLRLLAKEILDQI